MERVTAMKTRLTCLLLVLLLFAGCSEVISDPPDTVRDQSTGAVSDYKFSVESAASITHEGVKEWLETCESESGHYGFISTTEDTCDIFVYTAKAQAEMGDNVISKNVTVDEINNLFYIYVKSDLNSTHDKKSEDLILHFKTTVKKDSGWPTQTVLEIDGDVIECVKVSKS